MVVTQTLKLVFLPPTVNLVNMFLMIFQIVRLLQAKTLWTKLMPSVWKMKTLAAPMKFCASCEKVLMASLAFQEDLRRTLR